MCKFLEAQALFEHNTNLYFFNADTPLTIQIYIFIMFWF